MATRKKSLNFITYDLPYPLTSGGKIRAYYLLRALAKDYRVNLFSFYRQERQKRDVSRLRGELPLASVRLYKRRFVWHPLNLVKAGLSSLPLLSVSYLHPQLKADLRRSGASIFHWEAFGPATYLPFFAGRGAVTVFGSENIEWRVYQKIAKKRGFPPPLKWLMGVDIYKMRRLEHRLYRLADVNLAVSPTDCAYIKEASSKDCFLIKNGVDLGRLSKIRQKREADLCFGGDLVYQQNSDALRWFLEKVLPLLKSKPSLKVVSLTKPSWLARWSSQIEVLDSPGLFAPQVYAQAKVFLAPIRAGGGTNIKILEAMAVKTPVVATTLGAQALGAQDGRHLLVADSPQEFAMVVETLLADKSRRDKMAKNAYQFVSQNYSWQAQGDRLRQIYQERVIPACC